MPPQSPQEQKAIVQRMIDAGESEENIATVIQHFKTTATDTKPPAPKHPLAEFGIGALKGIASTAIGAADLVNRGASALGVTERIRPQVFTAARQEFATPTSAGQSLGKGVEQVAELATPMGLEGAAVRGFVNAPRLVRGAARLVTGAAEGATKAGVQSGGDTSQVAAGATGGAAAPVVGAVTQAAAKYGTRTAQGLMQSALKPGIARMRDVIKGKAAVPPVVDTLLKEGVNVTEGGVGKLTRLLNAKKDELESVISQATGTIFPDDVARRALTSRAKFATQATPTSDLRSFDDAIDEFVQVHGGVTGLKPMSVQRAQELKTGTYENVGGKAFGELKSASVEGQKALARGLKEEIEVAIPNADVKGINRQIGNLTEAQQETGRRVGVANNRDPMGITPLASNSANFIAMLMLRNPMVKSLLARGLYKSAARAANVPEAAIRAAVLGIATSGQDESKEPQ